MTNTKWMSFQKFLGPLNIFDIRTELQIVVPSKGTADRSALKTSMGNES